jgi:hypothetical protein
VRGERRCYDFKASPAKHVRFGPDDRGLRDPKRKRHDRFGPPKRDLAVRELHRDFMHVDRLRAVDG